MLRASLKGIAACCLTAGLLALPACGVEDSMKAGDEGTGLPATPATEEAEGTEQQKNSAGKCCWWHCNSTASYYDAGVKKGCLEHAIRWCMSHGHTWKNGDAWWVDC